MDDIKLDPELGVNPKLMYCRRCGGDTNGLALIGSNKGIYKCPAGHQMFGKPTPRIDDGDCPFCKSRVCWERVGEVGEHDRLPDNEHCDKCKAEEKLHADIVAAGGVYVKCRDCGINGVAKAESGLAKLARERMNLPAPAPLGAEIDKAMGCPRCKELKDQKAAKEKNHGDGS